MHLDLSKSLTSTPASSGAAATSTSSSGSSSSGSSSSNSGTVSDDPTDDIPLTPQQRMIVAHAIFCVVGFALFLPSGVLLARYLRTFTPTWYTGHWIAQFGIGKFLSSVALLINRSILYVAGPTIIVGVVLGFQAAGKIGATIWDNHKASHASCVRCHSGSDTGAENRCHRLCALSRAM